MWTNTTCKSFWRCNCIFNWCFRNFITWNCNINAFCFCNLRYCCRYAYINCCTWFRNINNINCCTSFNNNFTTCCINIYKVNISKNMEWIVCCCININCCCITIEVYCCFWSIYCYCFIFTSNNYFCFWRSIVNCKCSNFSFNTNKFC